MHKDRTSLDLLEDSYLALRSSCIVHLPIAHVHWRATKKKWQTVYWSCDLCTRLASFDKHNVEVLASYYTRPLHRLYMIRPILRQISHKLCGLGLAGKPARQVFHRMFLAIGVQGRIPLARVCTGPTALLPAVHLCDQVQDQHECTPVQPHRRAPLQVSHVRKQVHSELPPETAPAQPHRRAPLQVPSVPERVHPELPPEAAPAHPHRRASLFLQAVCCILFTKGNPLQAHVRSHREEALKVSRCRSPWMNTGHSCLCGANSITASSALM
ncbi:uncharacterized protein [Dermacentor albipictus]|uniref:uncharacterized protein isoform X3 n=1 Tax=Dermacentor albipictus TaxID=60249 RepID=UPI0038FC8F0C